MNKKGFAVYLTLVVVSVVFMLVASGLGIAKSSVDIGISHALSTQAFHAADGGIERGLGRLRAAFEPFEFGYSCNLGKNRTLEVNVSASKTAGGMSLTATANIKEGGKGVAMCSLSRGEVKNLPGRAGIGNLTKGLINNEK